MQPPMRSAQVTVPAPQSPVRPPESTRPERSPSGGSRKWIVGLVLIAAAVGAAAFWQRQQAARQAAASKTEVIRTHKVSGGGVDRTVRLTGTTSAENFVSLIAPQLHGSRGDHGRDYSSRSGSSGSSQAVQSSNTSTSSGDGSGTSRATNKSSSARSSSAKTSSSISKAVSAAAAGGDLGSTASSIPSSSGRGGGGDFALILQQLVKPGATVKKGDTIAEFDRQFMLLRLDDYRAAVMQQELDMKKLVANLEISRKARQQEIDAASGAVGKAELDLRTTPVRSEIDTVGLQLAVEEARARLKQLQMAQPFSEISELSAIRNEELDFKKAQIELRRAEANADKMIAKASIDGLTVMQNIFRGTEFAQIQQGDQLSPGQFYMQIVDTRSMVINAVVSQMDIDKMKIGSKAHVRFDAYPDLELPAHIYSIGAMTKPGGMRASYVKDVPVKLKLDKLDPRVIPDLSVAVDVIAESEQAVVVAPLEGVFRDAEAAKPFVFVRAADGWLRRDVELGLANNTRVAVRSGLKPTEVIALNRPPAVQKE
jgi:HlyD family secretion protein